MSNPKGIVLSDIFTTISELSNAVYHLCDHVLLLNRIKAVEFKPTFIAKWDYFCNLLWCSENTNCLIADVIDYYNLIMGMKSTKIDLLKIENYESTGIIKITPLEYKDLLERRLSQHEKKFKLKIDIIRCLADFPV
jgi:hypothetical protein